MSGHFAANEMQAVVAAAIAGYGIAQLPCQVAEASLERELTNKAKDAIAVRPEPTRPTGRPRKQKVSR